MKACAAILFAALVAGVAQAGFFAHPLPLLRTPRVYNIIVRSDGNLLPSAAYSLPLDHPIFHNAGKAAEGKDSSAAASTEAPGDADSAPAASTPAPPHLPVPPALPITHVAVNFPGATVTNSSSAPTVVATTLPFYSLYHPYAFPLPDPTPFIHHPFAHPGYFFGPAFHAPALPGEAKAQEAPKETAADAGEKAKEDEAKEEER
ncbi:uncharacterized protein LOC124165493 [Ischnura elegans]|uniref:uncharacterized protein LOC124165493 n=1 Tax=Ischnura elegans TaxID=197161 RepID=UPI001ED8A103|nr:uncharacterized protein LOC124165493 [Ischnura elegans]